MTKLTLPLRTVNSLNVREHWAKRAKRAKAEREVAYLMGRGLVREGSYVSVPITVLMTRIAPRMFDEGDNLPASLKHVRDGIADRLGVNDGSDAVKWRYAQRKGKPREYGVEIEVIA